MEFRDVVLSVSGTPFVSTEFRKRRKFGSLVCWKIFFGRESESMIISDQEVYIVLLKALMS